MNTSLDYNEQDTYDALRRIPRSQFEETHPHSTRTITRNEWRRSREDLDLAKELKRARLLSKLFFFSSHEIIALNTADDRTLLGQIYDRNFKGSGWTTEEYGNLVYKEATEVHLHNRKVSSEKHKAITLTYLGVVFCSLMSNIVLPTVLIQIIAPIFIGLAGGFIVSRIVRAYGKLEIDTYGSL